MSWKHKVKNKHVQRVSTAMMYIMTNVQMAPEYDNQGGPSMSYLSKMYYLWFFFINQVNLSYPHLLEFLSLIFHDDEPILPIYLSNVFAKNQ